MEMNNSNIPKDIQDYIERTEIRIKKIEEKQELRRQRKIQKELEHCNKPIILSKREMEEREYYENLRRGCERDLERENQFKNEEEFVIEFGQKQDLRAKRNKRNKKYIKENDLIGA